VVLKKGAGQRRVLANSAGNTPDPNTNPEGAETNKGFVFKGLKKYVPPEAEKPLDPFDGWSIEPQYYVVQDNYEVEWLTKTKDDPVAIAGGYDMRDFYSRALCDAFSGFGVFIEDEIEARQNQVSGDAIIGTHSAATAAVGGKDIHMDDVF
jgi:CDK-activating kinase assembly factor MAT1